MKKTTSYVSYIALTTFVFLTGIYIGYAHSPAVNSVTAVTNKESDIAPADFSLYWKAWQLIDQKSPNAEKATTDERIYGSIKGLLSSLDDPYTSFFTPDEAAAFQSEIEGSFEGVGIEIAEKNDVLTVIAPLKGTPAEKAGILAGDLIVKINDTSTESMTTDEAIHLIRGKGGTSVVLTILREGVTEPKVFTLVRDRITLPTVDTEAYETKDTFVIKLYNFSAQAPQLFAAALKKFQATGDKNLIIDLRNNPGGYLDAAVSIAGWFLPEGQLVVKEIGKDPSDVMVHNSKGPNTIHDKKVYILINRGSASASEILAGALKEHGIATLVGERSFGKGSVQEPISLPGGTLLKITVAKWYTPHGVSISDSGLTPDTLLKMGSAAPEKTTYTEDKELDQLLMLIH